MSDTNAPRRFEKKDHATLIAVLDEIIPPSRDGRLPGAGQAGIAESIIEELAKQAPQQELVAKGLAALDEEARRRDAINFSSLTREDRIEQMHALATDHPAFIPTLIYLTYTGYYQDPAVVIALGLETWPPHPKGFSVAPSDPALVDPVRKRGKIYRE